MRVATFWLGAGTAGKGWRQGLWREHLQERPRVITLVLLDYFVHAAWRHFGKLQRWGSWNTTPWPVRSNTVINAHDSLLVSSPAPHMHVSNLNAFFLRSAFRLPHLHERHQESHFRAFMSCPLAAPSRQVSNMSVHIIRRTQGPHMGHPKLSCLAEKASTGARSAG